jgi:hypothetical protein
MLDLGPTVVSLCKRILHGAESQRKLCRELREVLLAAGVLNYEETYDTIARNVKLMETLKNLFGLGFCATMTSTNWGLGIISDFDLFFNCRKDKVRL